MNTSKIQEVNNYLRKITALLPKGYRKYVSHRYLAYYLRNFLFLFFLILAGFLLQILVNLENRYDNERKNYALKSKEYHYWSSVAMQFPNIPDILYNTALSALNSGNKSEALDFVNKALQVDPLFRKAQELRIEILES